MFAPHDATHLPIAPIRPMPTTIPPGFALIDVPVVAVVTALVHFFGGALLNDALMPYYKDESGIAIAILLVITTPIAFVAGGTAQWVIRHARFVRGRRSLVGVVVVTSWAALVAGAILMLLVASGL